MKVINKLPLILISALLVLTVLPACSSEDESSENESEESVFDVKKEKAVYGKVKHVDISPEIDITMAKAGQEIFETKCNACHKYDVRYVGPPLGKVTERRTPEYVMNMILDTETMIENDDTVKCLLQTFLMKMPNQNVDEKGARNVLEHLRNYAQNTSKNR